jgi:hypothetical protein
MRPSYFGGMTSVTSDIACQAPEGRDVLPVAIFAVLFFLALCPILLVDIPAAVDYPNHLARMSVLSRDGTPAANPHYHVAWGLYPNLAMDLIVPPLARLMRVETATRLFYLASQVLVVTGSVAIELAVKRRFEIAGFIALLYLYSVPFAWGFVNFEFALGLALWGIAGWLVLRRLAVRLAFHTAVVAVLFISHLFALGLYGLTLGLYELHAFWVRRDAVRALCTVAILAAPAVAALVLFALAGGAVGGDDIEWEFAVKGLWLFVLNGYSLSLSVILTAALAFLAFELSRRRALILSGAGKCMLGGYALAFVLIPFRLFDTAFVDLRVVTAAALVLPAFVSLRLTEPRARAVLGSLAAALILINLGMVAVAQASYRRHYAEMIGSFAALEKGARILVAAIGDPVQPPRNLLDYPMFHAPTLALHYADAFVPTFFTYPGKQPVLPRATVARLAVMQGGPEPMALLRDIAFGTAATPVPAYIAHWHNDFDYLYVLGDPHPNPLPQSLEKVAGGSRFTAYRIHRPRPFEAPALRATLMGGG